MSEISFICWNHMKAYLIFYMRTYIHNSWVGTGGKRRKEGLTQVYMELYVCTREYSWVITELFIWRVNRTKETLESVENSLRWRGELIKCKNIIGVQIVMNRMAGLEKDTNIRDDIVWWSPNIIYTPHTLMDYHY